MAALTPGVLLKLLEATDRGKKLMREHRSTLLQVTDIVPVDLDEKSLFPKQGFYIKVSDSLHSIYVSLPPEQDDLVMSNKMQLGQFVYVDRLEPGTPVPVVIGAKPIPGRRPLTPEPLMAGLRKKTGEKKEFARIGNRRSCWGKIGGDTNRMCCYSPMALKKRVPLDSDQCSTLAKQNGRSICNKDRCELSKMANSSKPGERPLIRKSRVASSPSLASKSPRSRSDLGDGDRRRIPVSPSISSAKKSSSLTNAKSAVASTKSGSDREVHDLFNQSSDPVSAGSETCLPVDLPGKLSKLGKEALQQRETAQKLAEQALREASATETLIQSLKTFSDMTKSASPESPAGCFDKFLEFHARISQSIDEMNSIQPAATSVPATPKSKPGEKVKQMNPEEAFPALNELIRNSKRRTSSIYKPPTVQCSNSRLSRSSNDENKRPETTIAAATPSVSGSLSRMIKLGKDIEIEAGIWFVEFVEKALESGMKKCSRKEVPQLLMMKLFNWVENEQCKSKVHHPKAAQIARRLRIKMKNP